MMGAFAVSPANVQAHLFLGDVLYRVVDGLDVKSHQFLELLQRLVLVRNVPFHGQVGTVQLKNQPPRNDEFVLLSHLSGQGDNVVFVAGVKIVLHRQGNYARRRRAHEQLFRLRTGLRHRRQQIVAFPLGQVHPAVRQGSNARWNVPHQLYHPGPGDGRELILVPMPSPGPRAAEARHPLGYVGRKADPRLLSAIDYVHSGFRLGLDYAQSRLSGSTLQRLLIDRVPSGDRPQHINQTIRSGQAAAVGGQDACLAAFHDSSSSWRGSSPGGGVAGGRMRNRTVPSAS